ncbi:MAG TPA: hypothetical protein VIN59_01030 [Alphaproteobacteria bacterium]
MKHIQKQHLKAEFTVLNSFGNTVTLAFKDVDYIVSYRNQRTAIFARDGKIFTGDPIKTLVHPFSNHKTLRERLEEVAVHQVSKFTDADGVEHSSIDRRSAESFISGYRPQ